MIEVAVTGIGILCAQGLNYEECKKNIFENPIPPSMPRRFETPNLDYLVFDIPREIEYIFSKPAKEFDVFFSTLLSLKAFEDALENAKLSLEDLKGKNVLISLGTTIGTTLNNFEFHKEFVKGRSPENKAFEVFLKSNPSNFLSKFLKDVNTFPLTIATACASGADSIGIGFLALQQNLELDFVICGGTDEVSVVNHQGFISMHIYSKKRCKPFDKNRDGLNLGNGAGILILERKESAIKRGLKPQIFISGYGSYQDGYHFTHPHPDGIGLEKSIVKALSYKNMDIKEIDFVNVHGTATPENDKTEGKVLKRLFGEKLKFLSTKGYTGHTLGAAGAIEAIFSIMALKEGKLMKSIGFSEVDPEIGLVPIIENIEVERNIAFSTSLGFAGANSAILFERKFNGIWNN